MSLASTDGIRGSNVAVYYINVRAFDVLPGLPFKEGDSFMDVARDMAVVASEPGAAWQAGTADTGRRAQQAVITSCRLKITSHSHRADGECITVR